MTYGYCDLRRAVYTKAFKTLLISGDPDLLSIAQLRVSVFAHDRDIAFHCEQFLSASAAVERLFDERYIAERQFGANSHEFKEVAAFLSRMIETRDDEREVLLEMLR